MIKIEKVYTIGFNSYRCENNKTEQYIEFLPDKSLYDGMENKKRFAVFKYGGIVNDFVVTLSVKVFYSVKQKQEVREKLEEFAYDLIDDEFIDNIQRAVTNISMPMFE